MPNRKNLYADMEKFTITRNAQRLRYYQKTGSLFFGRRKWTPEEDKLILEHKITDNELSSILCRSVEAIQIRRTRLKRENKKS